MWEASTEVGTIDIELLLSWQVHILAPGAVHLYSRSGQLLRYTNWQDILSVAQDSWADAECSLLELLSHFVQTVWGQDEPSMDDSIQVHC